MGVRELARADRVLGRHLFVAESGGPERRFQREARLDTAIGDGVRALESFVRFEELRVMLGAIDEYGQAEAGEAMSLDPAAPWPDDLDGTVVEATGVVAAIRVALPVGATLAGTTTFACDAGFVRIAAVSPAPPLGDIATAWVEGQSFMETRVHARIDGHAFIELRLGTSLHDVSEPRDPAWKVEGAELQAWRQMNQHVIAAMASALATAGFAPA